MARPFGDRVDTVRDYRAVRARAREGAPKGGRRARAPSSLAVASRTVHREHLHAAVCARIGSAPEPGGHMINVAQPLWRCMSHARDQEYVAVANGQVIQHADDDEHTRNQQNVVSPRTPRTARPVSIPVRHFLPLGCRGSASWRGRRAQHHTVFHICRRCPSLGVLTFGQAPVGPSGIRRLLPTPSARPTHPTRQVANSHRS